jgi:hypothetical protein
VFDKNQRVTHAAIVENKRLGEGRGQRVGRRSCTVECRRRYAAAATPLTSAQTVKAPRLAAR